jgi:hypothetical protein
LWNLHTKENLATRRIGRGIAKRVCAPPKSFELQQEHALIFLEEMTRLSWGRRVKKSHFLMDVIYERPISKFTL